MCCITHDGPVRLPHKHTLAPRERHLRNGSDLTYSSGVMMERRWLRVMLKSHERYLNQLSSNSTYSLRIVLFQADDARIGLTHEYARVDERGEGGHVMKIRLRSSSSCEGTLKHTFTTFAGLFLTIVLVFTGAFFTAGAFLTACHR